MFLLFVLRGRKDSGGDSTLTIECERFSCVSGQQQSPLLGKVPQFLEGACTRIKGKELFVGFIKYRFIEFILTMIPFLIYFLCLFWSEVTISLVALDKVCQILF